MKDTYTFEEIREAIILNHKEVYGWTEKKGEERGCYFIVGFVRDSLLEYENNKDK